MLGTWRTGARLRQLPLAAAGLLAALAGAAWACNPQAHISLDKAVYEAGSTITVYGSYFTADATITVTTSGGMTTTVQTSAGGGFVTQLTAPATPGNYSITASKPTGGFAPAAFQVVAAPPAPPGTPPEQVPAPPPPALAPDVPGPAILRAKRANEIVVVSRTGTIELLCGRFEEVGVSGICGAVSAVTTPAGAAPLLDLRAKAFAARAGVAVRVRYHLTQRLLRRVKTARQVRMRGTVVAVGTLGGQATTTFGFTLKLAPPRAIRLR